MEQSGVSAIAKYLKKNKIPSYFVVPQCPSDHEWDGRDGRPGYTERVEELISFYLSSGDIDPDRVYICGVSMGASGVWKLLKDNPYKVDPENLNKIKVEQLILSGKPYESAVTSLGKCIWRGLFSKNRY